MADQPPQLPPGAAPQGQSSKEQAERQKQAAEARNHMLSQILDGEARERLSRISMVKPEKARGVEELLIRMAQTGQLQGRVDEPQLIQLLGQVNEQTKKPETKIKFNRRGDDDDFNEDDLFKD